MKLPVPAKIELTGELISDPEARVTPAGSRTLRLQIDCGERGEHLIVQVVMAGDRTTKLARQLRTGERVRATGILRALFKDQPRRTKPAIEVVANCLGRESSDGKL
jgi:ribosomal protein S6